MYLLAFALYDTKVGSYGTPFFFNHPAEAMRACVDLGQDRSTIVARHPEDYALHQVGQFDTDTGLFTPQQPASLGSVRSMLPAPAPSMPLFDGAPGVRLSKPNGHADVLEA